MHLRLHQEFQEVLENYRISDRAKEVLQDIRLVLLIAPTSSGKNTIIQHQVQTGKYYYIVSDTTREPRKNWQI
jgi:hypothetical protein